VIKTKQQIGISITVGDEKSVKVGTLDNQILVKITPLGRIQAKKPSMKV